MKVKNFPSSMLVSVFGVSPEVAGTVGSTEAVGSVVEVVVTVPVSVCDTTFSSARRARSSAAFTALLDTRNAMPKPSAAVASATPATIAMPCLLRRSIAMMPPGGRVVSLR